MSRHELVPGKLTPRQRQITRMFVDGMTYVEVARVLGLSPGTINPVLRQAARRMGCPGIGRKVLQKWMLETGNVDP